MVRYIVDPHREVTDDARIVSICNTLSALRAENSLIITVLPLVSLDTTPLKAFVSVSRLNNPGGCGESQENFA